MKTQIINRTILLVTAIFFAFNNNGGNIQPATILNYNTIVADNNETLSSCSSLIKETQQPKQFVCFGCAIVNHEDVPAIPEPDGDHEFRSFNVNHNEKRITFWKSIADKIVEIIYYVVVLIVYTPYKMLS